MDSTTAPEQSSRPSLSLKSNQVHPENAKPIDPQGVTRGVSQATLRNSTERRKESRFARFFGCLQNGLAFFGFIDIGIFIGLGFAIIIDGGGVVFWLYFEPHEEVNRISSPHNSTNTNTTQYPPSQQNMTSSPIFYDQPMRTSVHMAVMHLICLISNGALLVGTITDNVILCVTWIIVRIIWFSGALLAWLHSLDYMIPSRLIMKGDQSTTEKMHQQIIYYGYIVIMVFFIWMIVLTILMICDILNEIYDYQFRMAVNPPPIRVLLPPGGTKDSIVPPPSQTVRT